MIKNNLENISETELQQIHNTSVNEIRKAREKLNLELNSLEKMNLDVLGLDESDKEEIKENLISDFRSYCKYFIKIDIDAKRMYSDLLELNQQRVR